jgi:hypothetical protein
MVNETCTRIQKSMDELMASGADDARMDEVLDHVESCRACAAHFDLLGRLRAGEPVSEPEEAEFLAMRRSVLREIRKGEPVPGTLMDRIRAFFAQPAFAAGLAVVMLGVGFGAGTWSRPAAAPGSELIARSGDGLVGEIQLAAARHATFDDVMRAPYEYSNVKVAEQPDGRIALSFDVARHVDVVVAKSDPIVNEVLVQSLLGDASVGAKLRAISTSDAMNPKIREALTRAMLEDENLGVRLRAQERLVALKEDPVVEQALLEVLRDEESVQMRLVAIDYLTNVKTEPALVRQAVLGDLDEPRVDAVYVRAMQYVDQND